MYACEICQRPHTASGEAIERVDAKSKKLQLTISRHSGSQNRTAPDRIDLTIRGCNRILDSVPLGDIPKDDERLSEWVRETEQRLEQELRKRREEGSA